MKNFTRSFVLLLVLLLCSHGWTFAQEGTSLRRPVSPEQPMWLIHIDTWNHPDPQKIIDLVPKDIRPYVVMNISLSVSHDTETSQFTHAEYGVEVAKSWLRTCAANRMWAVVQPSSGGYTHLPDGDMTIYEELYEEFPNLIGFNYCEQSWGFGDNDPLSSTWLERIAHFTKLLEVNNKYGGYLVVSWCGNQWSPSINPIAMQKRNPDFAEACTNYTENFILCEKYTFTTYQSDMESLCLGSYLSGFSGQYGIRYDDTGWTVDGEIGKDFTMATYAVPFLEHVMLTGQTVIDAPELIWTHCFKEVSPVSTTDGYKTRKWETFLPFDNVSVDLFRKVIDGTVRIPTRQEVIDRTKVVIINDVTEGDIDDMYSSPETLFQGLYRMTGDGNYHENSSFFKKTGRFPTVPTVFRLNDDVANTFEVQLNKSTLDSRWTTIRRKEIEFENLFPSEYTGDLYAGRHENGWVTYNPYKENKIAKAIIPFKYNTCQSMELSYEQYTAGVIKEYSDRLTIYLSNYDNEVNPGEQTNTIKIHGCSAEPTFTFNDRGNNILSTVTGEYADGTFTLTAIHNGPLDIHVNCSGSATDRLTEFTESNLVVPTSPPAHKGALQYEGETFEYKNIVGIVSSGSSGNIRNYTGQGYLQFGTNEAAAVRDHVTVTKSGTYLIETKYTTVGSDVTTIDLYVNGELVTTPTFTATTALSEWGVNTQAVELAAGENVIEYKANAAGVQTIYFDNFMVRTDNSDGIWLEAECGAVGSLWDVLTDENASGGTYVTVKAENNSNDAAPADDTGLIKYTFDVTEAGTYALHFRVICPNYADDSFWLKMDDADFVYWNQIPASSDWQWVEYANTYQLTKGTHTFTVGYREDGAKLDKIFLTKAGIVPSELGGSATNCEVVENQAPFAFAGNDKKIVDLEGSGTMTVALRAAGSVDPDGTIVSYEWKEGQQILATEENPNIDLAVGEHILTLTVTDDSGASDSDDIVITIYENNFGASNIYVEPECATMGPNWELIDDAEASKGTYVTVTPGIESPSAAPEESECIVIPFDVTNPGAYTLYVRVRCETYNDDSFWIKMNDADFVTFNGLVTGTDWMWIKLTDYELTEGQHTITVGYREDGAQLDKLFFTKNIDLPQGLGEQAVNCEEEPLALEPMGERPLMSQNFPNPFSVSTSIRYRLQKAGLVSLKIYDINGQEIKTIVNAQQQAGEYKINWQPKGISAGYYFYRLQVDNAVETQKLFYQK